MEGIPVEGVVEWLMQHGRKSFVDALAWRLVNKGPPPDGPARFRNSPKDAPQEKVSEARPKPERNERLVEVD